MHAGVASISCIIVTSSCGTRWGQWRGRHGAQQQWWQGEGRDACTSCLDRPLIHLVAAAGTSSPWAACGFVQGTGQHEHNARAWTMNSTLTTTSRLGSSTCQGLLVCVAHCQNAAIMMHAMHHVAPVAQLISCRKRLLACAAQLLMLPRSNRDRAALLFVVVRGPVRQ